MKQDTQTNQKKKKKKTPQTNQMKPKQTRLNINVI